MQKDFKKQNISSAKKIIFVLVFSVFFTFSGAREADAWMAIPAELMGQAMTAIQNIIEGMTMGSLQQAAIKMIMRQKDRFIAGTTANGARFITNWKDYLVDNPKRSAQRYANDYISSALSGRGSVTYRKSSNSVLGASTVAGEGFGKEAVLGDASDITSDVSYANTVQGMAQNIVEPQQWQLTYFDDPTDMFQGDNLKNMNLYIMGDGNGGNTIWDADSAIQKEYNAALEQEKLTAVAQSNAYNGYNGQTASDGTTIVKPGIDFEQMQANIDDLPNKAIAGAKNVGELAAATVSSAISGMFNKAVAGVENAVNRQVDRVTDKAVQQTNKKVNSYGPGALYQK